MLFADALNELFKRHSTIEAITWSDYFNVRGGGNYAFEALLKAVSEIEFAVFFLTRDWKLDHIKPSFAATPNVWFEAGMFMSRYGKENVLLIEEEQDVHSTKIQYITDLTGLQPEYYKLQDTTKRRLYYAKSVPTWSSISEKYKMDILHSLEKVKGKIEENIFDDTERVFNTINIANRKECYKHGERIIQSASKHIFSIVSYENEYEDDDHPYGLFPYIEDRLKELMKEPGFSGQKSKKIFKRWMNLANDKIASQAEYILENYSDYIEIKDTFCNFIEVLISEQEVLIVLPTPENNKAVIGRGVLIKSKEIAREFISWFENLIPEPNNFLIDSKDKLDFYRKQTWALKNRRMEGDNNRCNACFGSVKSMPNPFKNLLKNEGLLKN